ncbi:MAG TPA: AmmeMemoRadiSam system protein A [Candidatus Limnocylindrales bacterium]
MPSEVVNAPAAPELDEDAAAALLRLARDAVVAATRGRPAPVVDQASLPPVLLKPAAAFVTLHERGELRGCLGNLEFDRPLWRNVLIAGAIVPLEDPRFVPVIESELPAIRIEVSVLAPPVELPGPEAFDARSQGIIVKRSGRRALLLPQVAEEFGWDAATTLEAVCRKAGLASDAWRRAGTRLFGFRAVHVAEPGFAR